MWVESVAYGFIQTGPPEAIDAILETVPVAAVEITGHMWIDTPANDDTEL